MRSQIQITVGTRDGQSVLQNVFITPPYKIMSLPKSSPHERWSSALNLMQMTASPGLLAGDQTDIELQLHQNAGLYWQTQSFSRVLSMDDGQTAVQNTRIRMAAGSRLHHIPHPLVLHSGAHFQQSMRVDLTHDCELILGEVIASGRRLNDEHFAFSRLSSQTYIYQDAEPLLFDNIQWQPKTQNMLALGQMEGFSHQAGLYYVNTAADFRGAEVYQRLAEYLDAMQQQNGQAILLGVSHPSPSLCVVRGLAHHAELLQNILTECSHILMRDRVID